jgi:hypothetical protein
MSPSVTHIERRTACVLANHPIPEMTDPLGTSWHQPSREAITVDDVTATMSQATFDALAEYSASQPSGVYPGKMWKRHDGVHDREFIACGGQPVWVLCWYDFIDRDPEYCGTKWRRIIVEGVA